MANISGGPIVVFGNSIFEINSALAEIVERIDELKGLRGRAMIYDRLRVGDAVDSDDAVNLSSFAANRGQTDSRYLMLGSTTGVNPRFKDLEGRIEAAERKASLGQGHGGLQRRQDHDEAKRYALVVGTL